MSGFLPIMKRAIHLLLVAGLLVLVWQTVTSGFALASRQSLPELAVSQAPNNALALAALARHQLSAGDFAGAMQTGRRALRRDPTNAAAAGTLSIGFARQGDKARSMAMLAYADGLSRRDLPNQLWAIETAVQNNDIAGALHHYDIALRVGASMPTMLFPILTSASADPAIRAPLAQMLAKGTPWKLSFLEYLSAQTPDIVSAARLIDTIYAAGGTVPRGPTNILIQRLMEANDVERAWSLYAHANSGARRVGVRNGDFSAAPDAPTLFDWRLEDNGEMRAEIVRYARDGELRVEAPPGLGGTVARQYMVLPPGDYALSYTAHAAKGATLGSSAVEVFCMPSQQRIVRKQIGDAAKSRQQMRFTVPKDCPSQSLALTLNADGSETAIEGAIDNVILAHATAAASLQ